jgi:hypothetical protein
MNGEVIADHWSPVTRRSTLGLRMVKCAISGTLALPGDRPIAVERPPR